MQHQRVEVRLPVEADRARLIELFRDPSFMAYTDPYDVPGANARIDHMLRRTIEFPFAKQCIIERSTGAIVGYSGADLVDFEGAQRFEFGYRLDQHARGRGYATEAGVLVLDVMARSFHGEVLAFIAPGNTASERVVGRLGFTFWKQALVDGFVDNVFRRDV